MTMYRASGAAGFMLVFASLTACTSAASSGGPSSASATESARSVVVSDVTGKYVADVEQALCAAGLRPRIIEAHPIDRAGPNDNGYVVARVTPAVGSSVPAGSTINLSLGTSMNAGGPFPSPPARAVVPNVADKDVNMAISTLTGIGFEVNVTVRTPADGLVVVSQSPSAGSTLGTKTPVTLVGGSSTGGACS